MDLNITGINFPIVTIIDTVARLNKSLINDVLNAVDAKDLGIDMYRDVLRNYDVITDPLYVTHTVAEWLWGFEDPLIGRIKGILASHGVVLPPDTGVFALSTNNSDAFYKNYTVAYTGKVRDVM